MSKPFGGAAAILLACLVVTPACATMTVADFLGKVDGLKAKGPLALFSADIGKLKREGKEAVTVFYEQASPPGKPRNACPPPRDKFDMADGEFMGMLKAVPVPERTNVSVAQAVTAGLNRRYPCPA